MNDERDRHTGDFHGSPIPNCLSSQDKCKHKVVAWYLIDGKDYPKTSIYCHFCRGIKKARTHVSSSNRHGEMNLARVLVTICVVFLVCNSLRLFLGLQAIINVNKTIQCVSINKAWIPPGWMLILESVSHLLLLISSSSNFLIYCTISTKFKIYIKRNFFWR